MPLAEGEDQMRITFQGRRDSGRWHPVKQDSEKKNNSSSLLGSKKPPLEDGSEVRRDVA